MAGDSAQDNGDHTQQADAFLYGNHLINNQSNGVLDGTDN
jgi:hypothetical protein